MFFVIVAKPNLLHRTGIFVAMIMWAKKNGGGGGSHSPFTPPLPYL